MACSQQKMKNIREQEQAWLCMGQQSQSKVIQSSIPFSKTVARWLVQSSFRKFIWDLFYYIFSQKIVLL
jgi:hypothetical protein